MPQPKTPTWRRHYWRTVGNLSHGDTQLARSLTQAETAIYKRFQEIEHSPEHGVERQDLSKAVDGLLLIKTVVLGWPDFKPQDTHIS